MPRKPATPRGKSGQEPPAAGSPARPLHGRFWEVAPGTPENGPEYFGQPGLAAMAAALTRAAFLAFSPVQEIIWHSPGSKAKVLWRYEHGQATLKPGSVIPARKEQDQ